MKKLVILLVALMVVPVVLAQQPAYVTDAYGNRVPFYDVSRNPYGGDVHRGTVAQKQNPSMIIRSAEPRQWSHIVPEYQYASVVGQCGARCAAKQRACIQSGRSAAECRQETRQCTTECKVAGPSSCQSRCAAQYQACVGTMSANECYARFGTCQEQCVPRVERPAPTEETCLAECDGAYQSCVNAGGSVATCSSRVYDACAQKCPSTERAEQTTQTMAGRVTGAYGLSCDSCGAQCGVQYERCVRADGANCDSQVLSCLRGCHPVVEKRMGPTAQVVRAQPTVWERLTSWLG